MQWRLIVCRPCKHIDELSTHTSDITCVSRGRRAKGLGLVVEHRHLPGPLGPPRVVGEQVGDGVGEVDSAGFAGVGCKKIHESFFRSALLHPLPCRSGFDDDDDDGHHEDEDGVPDEWDQAEPEEALAGLEEVGGHRGGHVGELFVQVAGLPVVEPADGHE